jgi:hypothetical protein
MCITASALAVFLNLLSPDLVSAAPGRITVHADVGDAHWVPRGDLWCTVRPLIGEETEGE